MTRLAWFAVGALAGFVAGVCWWHGALVGGWDDETTRGWWHDD